MHNQLVTVFLLPIVCIWLQTATVSSTHHVPTQISIYYETLCPDSRRFFLHQLAPTYEKLNRFMDVELIPYGHANVSYPRHDNKPVFHCQHGPQECYGNKVQACTIDMLKDTTVSLNFVKCMFAQKDWHDTQTSAETCANQLGLEWPKIKSCSEGSEGERLLIANSLKTFNLSPEQNYIPWVVIGKVHTAELQQQSESNLLKFLCDNYFSHDPQIPHCKEEAIASQSQYSSGSRLNVKTLLYLPVILSLTLWSLQ